MKWWLAANSGIVWSGRKGDSDLRLNGRCRHLCTIATQCDLLLLLSYCCHAVPCRPSPVMVTLQGQVELSQPEQPLKRGAVVRLAV